MRHISTEYNDGLPVKDGCLHVFAYDVVDATQFRVYFHTNVRNHVMFRSLHESRLHALRRHADDIVPDTLDLSVQRLPRVGQHAKYEL